MLSLCKSVSNVNFHRMCLNAVLTHRCEVPHIQEPLGNHETISGNSESLEGNEVK